MTRRRRRAPFAERSAREWAGRGSLAVLALALGYAATTRSLADAVKRGDPVLAHRLNPADARATALFAQRRFVAHPAATGQAPIAALAAQALARDPTAVPAVAVLGLQAQLRGDGAAARRLFFYAEQLSRRDLPGQLWAVEDAVSRGDVGGALNHYDLALRTSKTAPDVLFPVLAAAVGDAAVRPAMVRVLARKPPAWSGAFIDFVATARNDARATALLFGALPRAGVAVAPNASARLVDRMIAGGAMSDAWAYYATLHPSADPLRSRDPAFAGETQTGSKFDWTVVQDASIAASVQRGERGNLLDFSAPASVGGTVVRQLQILRPGTYRLLGVSSGIEQPEESLPYWSVTCEDGRVIARVTVPSSGEAQGRFGGTFVVPDGCRVQTLELVLRPSDQVEGSTGQIARVQIMPAEQERRGR